MKLLGVVFIFVSLSAAGVLIGENYISVLKSIKRAENFLNILLIGLENGRLSIGEMLEKARASGDIETVAFIDILKNSLMTGGSVNEKMFLESAFCKDKIAASSAFEAINILGKCSAEEQIEKMKYCRENIRKRYETAFDLYNKKAKLSRSSGILAGLLAVIIFI